MRHDSVLAEMDALVMTIRNIISRKATSADLHLVNNWEVLHECCTADVDTMKAESAPLKASIVERVNLLGPPPQFRLIDCHATLRQHQVVLVDGYLHPSYTIISHTWGEEVYGVFDCKCACECHASIPRCNPSKPCPGAAAHGTRHGEVVADILKMCELLVSKAASEFVWHDGVCIAQHNHKEVEETIRHMGWLYANATDTIIFMDYVGRPMPLLSSCEPYCTRWITRVWTLQEAMLSSRRRYCIRRVSARFQGIPTFADLEARLESSIEDDSCIQVVEEDILWVDLLLLFLALEVIRFFGNEVNLAPNLWKLNIWINSMGTWVCFLKDLCFRTPSLSTVLKACAWGRASKHEGDRINSVLALAGVTDYVAPKEDNFEASTIEFLKRLNGQDVILELAFSVNYWEPEEALGKQHTWLPSLSTPIPSTAYLRSVLPHSTLPLCPYLCKIPPTRSVVLVNGMLHLIGNLAAVAVEVTFQDASYNPKCPNQSMDEDKQCYIKNDIILMDVEVEAYSVGRGGYSSYARGASTKFGLASFPTSSRLASFRPSSLVSTRPVVQGRLMEEGSTFNAHLVFATNLMLRTEWDYGAAALVVAGDLRHPVCKLGCFSASSHLTSIISYLVPFTELDDLVII